MLEIDHQHGRFSSNESGADSGFGSGERGGAVCRATARGSLQLGGACGTSMPAWRAPTRGCAALSRTDDRSEPGTGDTPDRCLSADGTGGRSTESTDPVLRHLHRRRWIAQPRRPPSIHSCRAFSLSWMTMPRSSSRCARILDEELPRGVQGFTSRTRSARRRMQELERMSASQRQTQQAPKSLRNNYFTFDGLIV
jgi:hypothetical protein